MVQRSLTDDKEAGNLSIELEEGILICLIRKE